MKALALGLLLVACHPVSPYGIQPTLVLPLPPPVMVFKPALPTFLARPSEYSCQIVFPDGEQRSVTCLKILKTDMIDVLRELKRTCMALGRMAVECEMTMNPRPSPVDPDKPEDT